MSVRSFIVCVTASVLLSLTIAKSSSAAPSASREKMIAEPTREELHRLADDLKKLEPIILRLEKIRGLMAIARETSPTLEKLDKLMIKSDLVEKVNDLLARAEKIEPILKSLENLQRDFAERRSKETGMASAKVEQWSEILEHLRNRLDALEKRLYAPLALDDSAARQTPVELRLKALEDRQQSLIREIEALRKENQRLRRQQRQEGL
jgi:hypothetical protein